MIGVQLISANHCPTARVSLGDHLAWVGGALRDLGFPVEESAPDDGRFASDRLNLFWEHVPADMLPFLRGPDAPPYAMICTEKANPGLDGWNGNSGTSWRERLAAKVGESPLPRDLALFAMDAMGWETRWQNFCAAAERAAFIFTYFAEDVEILRQMGRPVAYLPLGWSPHLEMPDDAAPEVDFVTFGSLDRYRAKTIAGFRARNRTIAYPATLLPSADLGRHIQRGAIGLDIVGPNRIPTPSVARVARMLMARRLPVAEWTPDNMGAGLYAARPAQGEDFHDFAIRSLDGWREQATERLARFRDEMPMTQCMRRALDAVGVTLH